MVGIVYVPSFVVKKKPIDVSFTGVMSTIASTMKIGRSNSERGSSESFYGNALKNLPVSIDENTCEDCEDCALQLTESLHRVEPFDWEEDMNDAMRAYRRQSLANRTPTEEAIYEDDEFESTPEMESPVIHLKSMTSSVLDNQLGIDDIVLPWLFVHI